MKNTEEFKQKLVTLIEETAKAGARISVAAKEVGISVAVFYKWQNFLKSGKPLSDKRKGPTVHPKKLDKEEVAQVERILFSEEFADVSPDKIVPMLADQGKYLCSERTMYRILAKNGANVHRGKTSPKRHARPKTFVATKPNQVWSYDITYLPSQIKGQSYYMCTIVDVFSRKIVGQDVFPEETGENVSKLLDRTVAIEKVSTGLVIHSDNGKPMKNANVLALFQRLGIVNSYSRPSVSNDNPFSEALFKTLKYIPKHPLKGFKSLNEARAWANKVEHFYNKIHLHSSIKYVTPDSRHHFKDKIILVKRHEVYEEARKKNPVRWSKNIRNWRYSDTVVLNKSSITNGVMNNRKREEAA